MERGDSVHTHRGDRCGGHCGDRSEGNDGGGQQRESAREDWVVAVRAVLRAVDRTRLALAQHTGLTQPEVTTLELLHFDGRVPIRVVRERTGLSASAITAVIDRLERGGLARRVRVAADRRVVHLELTVLGRHHSTHLFDPLIEQVSPASRPSPTQTAALTALIALLEDITTLIATLPPPPSPPPHQR